jgi:zinc transporter ZupT
MTRQRAHILERAQAQLSSSTCRITTKKDDGERRRLSQTTEELSPSYASVEENRTDSSMEAAAGASDGESVYSALEEQSEYHTNERLDEKSPSRAWYEFDWVVLVALVAPACQWLTGGDYIKNLVMLVLLVYYLHQIIEGTHISRI